MEQSHPTHLKPFTVLGIVDSNGQILCDHVTASCESAAFKAAAKERFGSTDVLFVAALPGHLMEGAGVEFPMGGIVVDADTVLEQWDVFPADAESDTPSM